MSQAPRTETEDSWVGLGHPLDRELYVRCALACYRTTPTTAGTSDPQDRIVAAEIFEEGVSLELLQAALILAAARRSLREVAEPPLAPIRSLRYFLPLIKEITTTPIEPDYIRYLEESLLRLARSTPNSNC